MAKKCIICNETAEYVIKGTSDFYCNSCAEENFDDIKALQKIEEEIDAEAQEESPEESSQPEVDITLIEDTENTEDKR